MAEETYEYINKFWKGLLDCSSIHELNDIFNCIEEQNVHEIIEGNDEHADYLTTLRELFLNKELSAGDIMEYINEVHENYCNAYEATEEESEWINNAKKTYQEIHMFWEVLLECGSEEQLKEIFNKMTDKEVLEIFEEIIPCGETNSLACIQKFIAKNLPERLQLLFFVNSNPKCPVWTSIDNIRWYYIPHDVRSLILYPYFKYEYLGTGNPGINMMKYILTKR